VPDPGRALLLAASATYRLPLGLGSLLASRLLTLREKWRLAGLLARLGRLDTQRLNGVPLRDWLRQTAGAGNLAGLLEALFRVSTYANDPEALSAGSALEQLRLALAGNVWYLDGGWQTLIDGLRDRALSRGAEVRVGARASAVRRTEGGVRVYLADGEVLSARTVILAVGPRVACALLGLPPDAPLARWAAGGRLVRAACLDVALTRLPRPAQRFALGLDAPLYFSVHSAAARLAPEGVAVLHAMRYLGQGQDAPRAVERELEGLLDRVQPGWRAHLLARRFLPGMTVAHALPRADEGGLAGRPDVAVAGLPGVFVAGDWVGGRGMLADAAAASAEEAARCALTLLERPTAVAERSLSHARS
jgi:phytoene dehydrogenase-like protein